MTLHALSDRHWASVLLPVVVACTSAGASPATQPHTPVQAASSSVVKPDRKPTVMPMVAISEGAYIRCRSCGAKRRVEVTTRAFQIDQDEVTEAQYAACVAAKRCKSPVRPSAAEDLEDDAPVR
jgi:formylglycine-generating enzyme required for sulfatase activity